MLAPRRQHLALLGCVVMARQRNPWKVRDSRAELVERVKRGNSLDASRIERKERSKAEADWQRDIERLAQANGFYVWHVNNPQASKAGFPDLLLIRERVVWVELKAKSTTTNKRGKLSPEQEMWRDMLRAAGQEWFCWYNDSQADSAEAERVLAR